MKQYLSVLLCLVLCIVLIIFAFGCSSIKNPGQTPVGTLKYIGSRDLKAKSDSNITVADVLEDVSEIDLNMKMGDITGLTLKTEKNEEDSTSIDYYYRNDELIYAVYNGYGENVWEYYTTSKAGTPISVSFWDEGLGPNVRIKTNDESLKYQYNAYYENVGTDYGNGAEKIDVTISAGDEHFTNTISGNVYYISSALYWKDKSLHYYTADAEKGKITYEYDNEVISSDPPKANKDALEVIKGLKGLQDINIVYGTHKVYLNQDGTFFINAKTTLFIDTERNANDAISKLKSTSVKDNDFTVEENEDTGELEVTLGALTYEVSKDYENLKESMISMASEEVDDPSFRTVDFDSDNNLLKMDFSKYQLY